MKHLLATLVAATFLSPWCQSQTIQVNKENKTIAITATDSAEAEADTAEVSIGFSLYGTGQDQTYADASRISNAIVKALRAAGISESQIRSDSQRLTTIDSDDKLRYSQGIRFTFSQSWTVTTPAKSASDTLHVAVTAGANNSGGIAWRLADDNALEAEAAEKALSHAQQIAEHMAMGLHAKLGPLVYASNQAPQRSIFGMQLNTMSASVGQIKVNLKPLAIMPDKVTRSATVYAVFSID